LTVEILSRAVAQRKGDISTPFIDEEMHMVDERAVSLWEEGGGFWWWTNSSGNAWRSKHAEPPEEFADPLTGPPGHRRWRLDERWQELSFGAVFRAIG